jgi:putative ABC transport system permease protein
MPARPLPPARLGFRATLGLALRNIVRQRSRVATTLAAVTFGVVALILSQGFVQDIFVQLAEAIIHSQTGHIQVAEKGYFVHGSQKPADYLLRDVDADKARIARLPGVEFVTARLGFPGLVNNGRSDLAILGEGIEPATENKLGSYVKMVSGRTLAATDRYHAIVGAGVASALKLSPGDRINVLVSTGEGATNTLDFELVGVFQSFSKDYDNRAVKIPLAAAQELLDTRGASTLVAVLHDTGHTAEVVDSLARQAAPRGQEVKRWDEINDFYPKTVALYEKQFGGLRLVILLMVVLSVINAVNSAAFERAAEFGTMRAVGNRGRNILQIIVLENLLLGALGAAIGVAVGVALAFGISQVGIPMPAPPNSDLPYTALIRVTGASVATAAGIGGVSTVIAALLPAWRLSRMPITDALRQAI